MGYAKRRRRIRRRPETYPASTTNDKRTYLEPTDDDEESNEAPMANWEAWDVEISRLNVRRNLKNNQIKIFRHKIQPNFFRFGPKNLSFSSVFHMTNKN